MTSTFDPVQYSVAENRFLHDHFGEAPMVALHHGLPADVNVKAVTPLLQEVYDLKVLEEERGKPWAGVERLKGAVVTYLNQREEWERNHRIGGPKFPSLHSFDGRGRPSLGGIGSDAHQVRTYFDEHGKRHNFAVSLINEQGGGSWTAPWASQVEIPTEITEDNEKNSFSCQLCGHTETFKPDSAASRRTARARLASHMRRADDQRTEHMEYYKNVFKG